MEGVIKEKRPGRPPWNTFIRQIKKDARTGNNRALKYMMSDREEWRRWTDNQPTV